LEFVELFDIFIALLSIAVLKPGQVRCTGHTDYGFLTILYQDDCGGLEVSHLI